MSAIDLIEAATIAEAKVWQASQEQFLFCVDYLEISAHAINADFLVWSLETRFESLLQERKAV